MSRAPTLRFWHTRVVVTTSLTGTVAAVGDPGASRLVLLIVLMLVGLGAGLLAVAVWLWRATRVDPPSLAVLEVMGERRYARADIANRQALVDGARGQAAVEAEQEPPLPSDHG